MLDYKQSKPLIPGLTSRNRIVVPPMACQTASNLGFATNETMNHYRELAGSGAGIVFVEYTYVNGHGRSEANQLGLASDSQAVALSSVVLTIKQQGAIPAIQLTHGGGKSTKDLTGGTLWGPSPLQVPTKDADFEIMTPMSEEQIRALKNDFISAARRAIALGFQIIEFHSAHGYGLNQWLSPLTNQRSDRYGGTQQKRCQLLVDMVQEIKHECPGIAISVRMPGQDLMPGGLSQAQVAESVRLLDVAGVDLFNVSSGIGGWRRPRNRQGEGYLVSEAARIKAITQKTVIGVGGIVSKDYINDGLNTKLFDLAAIGRGILKDPAGFQRSFFPAQSK
ncbi:MAG: NADH:flavin oxidoreductase [Pseudobacteriovorax sp.]|nr:NADH:flavin oxidoreductase [Pseudobacteriovorax sp.]